MLKGWRKVDRLRVGRVIGEDDVRGRGRVHRVDVSGYADSKISVRLAPALMWLPPIARVRSPGVYVLDAWILPGKSLIVAVSELMSNPTLLPVSAMIN